MQKILALCLLAAPAFSQEAPAVPETEEYGLSLMKEGMLLVMRGMMAEMEPALDEMGKALDEIGPALEGFGEEIGPKLRQLVGMIDDFRNYDVPVMLRNGDILIRRSTPLAPRFEPVPGPNGEIEL